ncbi:putative cyclin-A3-1 [Nymphaea thermarum]|nr:putative cyclin-A3-1 [Nymphaea thermarum]
MSTDQENRVRVTRASAKRASAASSSLSSSAPPRKKRAVLGDVTNNIGSNSGILPSTPAPSKKKVVALVGVPVVAVDNVYPCGDDPQMCGPYASDIYQYLRESEKKRRPTPNYMESFQHDVTANMRSMLVDWLVEVAEEYTLLPDTLHLTIAYLDRFLSSNALYRQKLQLLGVSCMLIASKHEEICPPHVEDFSYITSNTYSKQESPNLVLEYLCNFLAEVCLIEYGCLQFLPSQIAASIVFVARFTLCPRTHPWSKHLQNQTGYKVSDLRDCIQVIHDLQLKSKNCTLAAVREKYKQHKFKSVSTLASPEKIPSTFFEDLN